MPWLYGMECGVYSTVKVGEALWPLIFSSTGVVWMVMQRESKLVQDTLCNSDVVDSVQYIPATTRRCGSMPLEREVHYALPVIGTEEKSDYSMQPSEKAKKRDCTQIFRRGQQAMQWLRLQLGLGLGSSNQREGRNTKPSSTTQRV